MHCTDIRKLRFIIRKTSSRRAPVHPRPRDERARLRATSPAWCQCSSCSTFVGVSGDGMQEPPNESDASVSTLIIVFGSYALYSLSSTFTCTVYLYRFGYGYWVKIY